MSMTRFTTDVLDLLQADVDKTTAACCSEGSNDKKKKRTTTTVMLEKPRGLVNQSNYCYLNSIVQSLLFIPAFQKLLQRNNLPSGTTLLASFQELFKIYQEEEKHLLDATSVHTALGRVMQSRLHHQHAPEDQEDAQEFLTYILEALHWELLPGNKSELARASPVTTETGWKEVCAKGTQVEKRVHQEEESPINRIFSGSMRVSSKSRTSPAQVIVEPFYCVTVDLLSQSATSEVVISLEDVLRKSFQVEHLEGGYRRQQQIETCPRVLILHVPRITYDAKEQEMKKILTPLDFPPELSLPSAKGIMQYAARAVIYHHGRSAYGGHYSCAVQVDPDRWYFADDRLINITNWESVCCPTSSHKTPYLLFYESTTTINNSNGNGK